MGRNKIKFFQFNSSDHFIELKIVLATTHSVVGVRKVANVWLLSVAVLCSTSEDLDILSPTVVSLKSSNSIVAKLNIFFACSETFKKTTTTTNPKCFTNLGFKAVLTPCDRERLKILNEPLYHQPESTLTPYIDAFQELKMFIETDIFKEMTKHVLNWISQYI